MQLLKNKKCIQVPKYSFTKYTRVNEYELLEPKKIIILEGLSILYDKKIRECIDMTLFLDIPDDLRLQRRIARDTQERGRKECDVIKQTLTQSDVMYHKYIEPTKQYADIISSDKNKVIKNIQLIINGIIMEANKNES